MVFMLQTTGSLFLLFGLLIHLPHPHKWCSSLPFLSSHVACVKGRGTDFQCHISCLSGRGYKLSTNLLSVGFFALELLLPYPLFFLTICAEIIYFLISLITMLIHSELASIKWTFWICPSGIIPLGWHRCIWECLVAMCSKQTHTFWGVKSEARGPSKIYHQHAPFLRPWKVTSGWLFSPTAPTLELGGSPARLRIFISKCTYTYDTK